MPLLLQTMAVGKTLQVEIAAVNDRGPAGAYLVDDYRFGTAALATSERSLGDEGSLTYTFEYGQEAVSHYDTDATGHTVLNGSQGWNRVRNVALHDADGAGGSGLPAQAATVKTDWSHATNPTTGTGDGGEPTTGGGTAPTARGRAHPRYRRCFLRRIDQ